MDCIKPFKNNKLINKIPSFGVNEVILSITLAILIIIPAHIYISRELFSSMKTAENNSIMLNLEYVLKQISEEFYTSGYSSSDFKPLNNENITLLQFKKYDGKLVRYYKIGREIVKDYNYTTYNAITPKIVSEFYVKRNDVNNTIVINLKIVGLNGEIATRTITKGKNN
jgi:hypothetical protein